MADRLRALVRLSWAGGMRFYLVNLIWFSFSLILAQTTGGSGAFLKVLLIDVVLGTLFLLVPGLTTHHLGVRIGILVGFAGLSALTEVWVPGCLECCSIYLVVLVATLFARPQVLLPLIATILGLTALSFLRDRPTPMATFTITMAATIGLATTLSRRNFVVTQRLKKANARLASLAVIAERERIGRDLHDVLGHSLTTIIVKSQLATRLVERDPAALQRELAEIEDVSRQALTEVRRVVTGLRGLRERAAAQGASLTVESSPAGTRVCMRKGSRDDQNRPGG